MSYHKKLKSCKTFETYMELMKPINNFDRDGYDRDGLDKDNKPKI